MKHTPGKWVVDYSPCTQDFFVCEDTALRLPLLKLNGNERIQEANAARIVACINACEKIANPEETIPDLLEACLKAAQELAYLISEAGEDPKRVGCFTQVRAAIARATEKENTMINYDKLPEHIREGVKRYIEHGVKPGSFLCAVISNNLKEAFMLSDDINQSRMKDIVSFFYYEAPSLCWGSPERMNEWIKSFTSER